MEILVLSVYLLLDSVVLLFVTRIDLECIVQYELDHIIMFTTFFLPESSHLVPYRDDFCFAFT